MSRYLDPAGRGWLHRRRDARSERQPPPASSGRKRWPKEPAGTSTRRAGTGCGTWRSFSSFESSQNAGLYPEITDSIVATAGSHAAAERHSASEKDADPLLHRDVGIRHAVARADDDVAEIEMIGRHVDGDHRLGALAAIDREFLGQESEQQSARDVLDDDDPLEAVLVVGRERDH